MAQVVKNLPADAGVPRDPGLIPGMGRFPGGEHGNLLQYSFWEISERSPWGSKESDTTEANEYSTINSVQCVCVKG